MVRQTQDGGAAVLPTVSGLATYGDLVFPAGDFDRPPAESDLSVRELGAIICEGFRARPALDMFDGLRLLSALGSGSDGVQSCWKAMSVSARSDQRAVGLAGLVRSGDVDSLAIIALHLDELSKSQTAGALATAISDFRVPQSEAVESLGAISEGGSRDLRFAATYALRVLATSASLPWLALRFADPDPQVRYQAIAGFATFANSGHVPVEERLRSPGQFLATGDGPFTSDQTKNNFPTVDRFLESEQQFLGFWSSWYQDHRMSIASRAQGQAVR